MIYAVFHDTVDGDRVLVGAFLMKSDAKNFIRNDLLSDRMYVVEVDGCWAEWSTIREAA